MVTQFDPATGVLGGIDQIRPAFVKRDEIAWVGTHRHSPDGDPPYIQSYVFAYLIDLPVGARGIVLPNDGRVRILAISAFRELYRIRPAGQLYAAGLAEPVLKAGS